MKTFKEIFEACYGEGSFNDEFTITAHSALNLYNLGMSLHHFDNLKDNYKKGSIISVSDWQKLGEGIKSTYEPVYSYVKGRTGYFEAYEVLFYKLYINIPRREAE